MMKFSLLLLLGSTQVNAFIPQFIVQFKTSTVRLNVAPPLYEGKAQPLFAEDDDMIPSIVQNSYWRDAGDIVVKELMYFDSLHSYYKTGKPLLDNANYDELHENLTWEGSSVATMSAQEAQFVSTVAASKRGEPLMDDDEYKALKADLKQKGSWVVNREEDALEKMGLNTFMGYLHRAL
eukprot:scaffold1054_cov281-Alexandrium_tamarense.AAC.16